MIFSEIKLRPESKMFRKMNMWIVILNDYVWHINFFSEFTSKSTSCYDKVVRGLGKNLPARNKAFLSLGSTVDFRMGIQN